MKISKSRGVITLGRDDTRRWSDAGPSGDRFRRETRETARQMANARGKAVEIYASASAGGWMADHIEAEVAS